MAMRSNLVFFLLACAVGAIVFLLVRLNGNDYLFFAGYTVVQFIVLATAWNILGGYCGYVNFGSAAFFAVGAYSSVALHKLGANVDRYAWEWQPPSHQFVPDTAAFTRAKNTRALRFALRAIAAQPLAYARIVARETVQPLIHTNVLRFPVSNRTVTTKSKSSARPPASTSHIGLVRAAAFISFAGRRTWPAGDHASGKVTSRQGVLERPPPRCSQSRRG